MLRPRTAAPAGTPRKFRLAGGWPRNAGPSAEAPLHECHGSGSLACPRHGLAILPRIEIIVIPFHRPLAKASDLGRVKDSLFRLKL